MSIIQLESQEVEDALSIIADDIALAQLTHDRNLIRRIRRLWNGERWSSIVKKANTPGSTWYVWWIDGARVFLSRKCR